jgi:alkanesulfonate monooxygenase SsuD/methylene tetrahydromethanopterin reductase-like flavin-dependent oxidoreductase (luciferase family)
MTAMTLAAMSGGRFDLGLGVSGPQVIEGWHGLRFERPVQRLRETVEIVRRAVRGERLTYEGCVYTLPLPGGEGNVDHHQEARNTRPAPCRRIAKWR